MIEQAPPSTPERRTFSAGLRCVVADFCTYQERLVIKHWLKAVVFICLFHRGWQLLFSIRIQEQLGRIPLVGSLLRRVVWYVTSVYTGTEINFRARFGQAVYFPHPCCIVIGDTWDIGDRVTIMQGVTLGRRHSDREPSRRSVLGPDVVVSAGAVLAGEISVGAGAVIGANAVVLDDLPAHCTAVGIPARVISH